MSSLNIVAATRSSSDPLVPSAPVKIERSCSDSQLHPLYSRREKLAASLETIRMNIRKYGEMLQKVEQVKMLESCSVISTLRPTCRLHQREYLLLLGLDPKIPPAELENIRLRTQFLKKNELQGEQGVLLAIEKVERAIQKRSEFLGELDLWTAQSADRGTVVERIVNAYDHAKLKLDLAHQQLTLLPLAITRLDSLQELDLSGNQLAALPSLQNMKCLGRLNLANNQLTELPRDLPETLSELVIFGNPVAQDVPQLKAFETARDLPVLISTQQDYETLLKSHADS